MTNYNFSSKFKHANIISITLFFISIILIAFKGLNYAFENCNADLSILIEDDICLGYATGQLSLV